MSKTNKSELDFQLWTPPLPGPPKHIGVKIWRDPLLSLVPKSATLCQSCVMRPFFLNSSIQDWCILRCSLDQLHYVNHAGAVCHLVSQPSLDWTGQSGVIGDHCGLSQSTYKEVSANRPVSEIRKVSIIKLIFVDKGNHEKVIPGYMFTFCITQPVAKKGNI